MDSQGQGYIHIFTKFQEFQSPELTFNIHNSYYYITCDQARGKVNLSTGKKLRGGAVKPQEEVKWDRYGIVHVHNSWDKRA